MSVTLASLSACPPAVYVPYEERLETHATLSAHLWDTLHHPWGQGSATQTWESWLGPPAGQPGPPVEHPSPYARQPGPFMGQVPPGPYAVRPGGWWGGGPSAGEDSTGHHLRGGPLTGQMEVGWIQGKGAILAETSPGSLGKEDPLVECPVDLHTDH